MVLSQKEPSAKKTAVVVRTLTAQTQGLRHIPRRTYPWNDCQWQEWRRKSTIYRSRAMPVMKLGIRWRTVENSFLFRQLSYMLNNWECVNSIYNAKVDKRCLSKNRSQICTLRHHRLLQVGEALAMVNHNVLSYERIKVEEVQTDIQSLNVASAK